MLFGNFHISIEIWTLVAAFYEKHPRNNPFGIPYWFESNKCSLSLGVSAVIEADVRIAKVPPDAMRCW